MPKKQRRAADKPASLSAVDDAPPLPPSSSSSSSKSTRQRVKKSSSRKSKSKTSITTAAAAPPPPPAQPPAQEEEVFQPPPLRPAEPHRPYRRRDRLVAGAPLPTAAPLLLLGDEEAADDDDAPLMLLLDADAPPDLLLPAGVAGGGSRRRRQQQQRRRGRRRATVDADGLVGDRSSGDDDDDDDDEDDEDDDEDDEDEDEDDEDDEDSDEIDDDDDEDDDAPDGAPASFFAGWLRGSRIGRGAFGEVYMGLNVDTGALFAEKVIELDYFDGGAAAARPLSSSILDEELDGHGWRNNNGRLEGVEEQINEARREIDLMRQLTHEHIVQYLGTKLTRHALSIYLEYISGGSILTLLKRFGPFPTRLVCNYTRQTLLGLAYLHGRNVIHRDIKSANLLVTEKGCVKLADFGCSKNVLSTLSLGARRRTASASGGVGGGAGGGGGDVDETVMRGTPNFMAPEVITKSQFQPPSDVWSLGATVLEMLTGHAPFGSGRDENIATVLFRIASLVAPPRAEYPAELADDPDMSGFLDCCFAIDPSLRATAAALIDFLDEREMAPVVIT